MYFELPFSNYNKKNVVDGDLLQFILRMEILG